MGDATKIGSVQTTLRVVEALLDRKSASLTELTDALDLPKSTVYNHLRTLQEEGYLRVEDDEYRLGLRFLELGESTRRQLSLFSIAKQRLENLAEETGELVNVAVEEDFEAVYVYLAYGPNAISLDTHAGKRVPLYCTAIGKCLLTHMDESRRERYIEAAALDPVTDNTITDPDALRDELATIRQQGYAIDHGERMEKIRCVAAPILVDGDCRGAVSLTSPVSRMRETRLNETIPEKVVDTASVIQINITYS